MLVQACFTWCARTHTHIHTMRVLNRHALIPLFETARRVSKGLKNRKQSGNPFVDRNCCLVADSWTVPRNRNADSSFAGSTAKRSGAGGGTIRLIQETHAKTRQALFVVNNITVDAVCNRCIISTWWLYIALHTRKLFWLYSVKCDKKALV